MGSQVVVAKFDNTGGTIRKVMADLAAKADAIEESEIRAKMNELMLLAIAEVKAGV